MSIQELILIQAAWECHATPLITLPVKETTGALPPRWLIEYHVHMSYHIFYVHYDGYNLFAPAFVSRQARHDE